MAFRHSFAALALCMGAASLSGCAMRAWGGRVACTTWENEKGDIAKGHLVIFGARLCPFQLGIC